MILTTNLLRLETVGLVTIVSCTTGVYIREFPDKLRLSGPPAHANTFEQYVKTHFVVKGSAGGALLSSKSVLISSVWFGGASTCISKVW